MKQPRNVCLFFSAAIVICSVSIGSGASIRPPGLSRRPAGQNSRLENDVILPVALTWPSGLLTTTAFAPSNGLAASLPETRTSQFDELKSISLSKSSHVEDKRHFPFDYPSISKPGIPSEPSHGKLLLAALQSLSSEDGSPASKSVTSKKVEIGVPFIRALSGPSSEPTAMLLFGSVLVAVAGLLHQRAKSANNRSA